MIGDPPTAGPDGEAWDRAIADLVAQDRDSRLHHAQAGAMAAFAELLEREGQFRAAFMADRMAAHYSAWAKNPDVIPPGPDFGVAEDHEHEWEASESEDDGDLIEMCVVCYETRKVQR